ncbi:MAG: undecaprenyl/decaprenyl-phosphate alpha-N-acetylglucosaminyl 1-phosphate transferase [Treponema sp.]|jgi:UDP-GlcNAc:undecaprenyl-phosphate GlcNAc-1-phosphate transferase|nr:undecaprenyl/decaprenyl-phosphate alpha-N-acetylglucosaminyl 1-phosphate transferase [Treponema sp.]
MVEMIIAGIASFVVSTASVAMVLRFSQIRAWYDTPDERKVHSGDVPRLGGLGFACAFILTSLVITFIFPERYFGFRFLPVLIAMALILLFGVTDDFHPLSPKAKLSIQIIAALLVILPGYTFHRLFSFDIGPLGTLHWIRYPLSVFWIIGLTNAINLIDGVDGLAGGVSALSALMYAAIFTGFKSNGVAVICVCLMASILGFLLFNAPIPRAKIFMGDGGSQFLGFTLAVLPLLNQEPDGRSLPLAETAAVLLIPIFDTFSAVWRRLRDGRRIDSPDRDHTHHKLINLGLNAWQLDSLLYGLQVLIGCLVFLSLQYHGPLSPALLGLAYLFGGGFFMLIHYTHRGALKKGAASSGPL